MNTFFAQLELQTGLCEPYRLAKAMGISLDDPADEMVPSFTLGVASVSPLELADAYATFAARGLHCDPRPVVSIDDSKGNQLKSYAPQCQQVIAAPVADAVNDVLRGVMSPTGFGANLMLNQESAGKTGTTDSNMSVWFMGYTPNLSTAAMVAGANRFGHWVTLNGQTIGGAYTDVAHGSTTAGPMWYGAMSQIQQWLPDATFTPPNGQDINGVLTTVPDVAGMPYDQAAQQLKDAGFQVADGGYRSSGYAADTVAYTSPGGGTQIASGTVVTIYRSNGTPYVPPKPHNGGGGDNNPGPGTGPGNGPRQRARPRALTAGLRAQSVGGESWRRTSAATAPPSARPCTWGVSDAHHLAHGAHPLAGRAGLGDHRGDQVRDLLVGELLGQVVGDHRRLGTLLVGELRASGVGEGGGRLAALLGLGREHPDDVVVAQLAGLLARHLGVGDRRQHHPDRRGAQLVAGLDRGGEVAAQPVLESAHQAPAEARAVRAVPWGVHARHCGSLTA